MSLSGRAIRDQYLDPCKPYCSELGSIPSKGIRKKKSKWKDNVIIKKLVVAESSCNPSVWEAEA